MMHSDTISSNHELQLLTTFHLVLALSASLRPK